MDIIYKDFLFQTYLQTMTKPNGQLVFLNMSYSL